MVPAARCAGYPVSASARSSARDEVVGQRALDRDLEPGERMDEGERAGVQELPREPEVTGHAVDGIAADRKVDRLEVHANLVRPPRPEGHVEERAPTEPSDELEVRHRVARRRGVEGAAHAVVPVPPDRSVDASRP